MYEAVEHKCESGKFTSDCGCECVKSVDAVMKAFEKSRDHL